MTKNYIDKLAYIHLKDGKILSALTKGKDTWYVPGGKREEGESDYEALMREVEEELTVQLIPDTITYYETFEAQAHGKPEGTIVRMTCYQAEFTGELNAASEIEQIAFVDYAWKDQSSVVDGLIFDDLKSKGLLH